MQRLEVSGAVQPIQGPLGIKGLIGINKQLPHAHAHTHTYTMCISEITLWVTNHLVRVFVSKGNGFAFNTLANLTQ